MRFECIYFLKGYSMTTVEDLYIRLLQKEKLHVCYEIVLPIIHSRSKHSIQFKCQDGGYYTLYYDRSKSLWLQLGQKFPHIEVLPA